MPLAFWTPGPSEMLLLGVIALLLYGGRLPDVAREWGKTFNEFRRSLNSVRDDFNDALYSEPDASHRLEYHPAFQDDASPDVVDSTDAVSADADLRNTDPTD